ncbi:LysR family transcriptional regulator [Ferrimonas balearica]|uniref:LysR family transcriptional regulator n=1 Tax=Ferrimonas balearica TaxID=44012 RepID=UPI001C56505C|nr:LysR family transcriptional regulator [Ferrimonas balearica]MBW3163778.1 LysR family transcriptional regulator [Ferrimonas balearica]MBY6223775.1 LysR family transcriptional regulator [Ferrimonas balearica]
MIFSIEQLNAFVTVYEYGSFSKAAEKLEKHRTTVGQVIGNLEDQVAVNLFERVGRSVEPTVEGELLYHYAKQVIEQARAFDKFAMSLSMEQLESINIGYSSFLPHLLLSDIRARLAECYPTMTVNFTAVSKSQLKQQINDGSIHLGLVNIEERSVVHSLDATFVGYVPLAIYVSKRSHLLDLDNEAVYAALKVERQLVLKSFLEDLPPEKVLLSANHEVIDQLSLVIKMTEQNLGWALLPRGVARSTYIQGHLVELKPRQFSEGVKFPIAVWSTYSKQMAGIKKTVSETIKGYLES